MTVRAISDVAFGTELTSLEPDTSLATVRRFADAVGWRVARFRDHARAREEGLPGALVPGIMAMGVLTALLHEWAPAGVVEHIDTVFRSPMLADESIIATAVVTDIDTDAGRVQLDLAVRTHTNEIRVFGTATVRLPNQ